MKKFFETIGLCVLLCISFIYTEKTVTVVKEFDDIMIQIKAKAEKDNVAFEDATIVKNTIVPGITGSMIDVDSSYSKMKRYGKYNEKLLVYTESKPNVSLMDNIDKYVIGGNKQKNMVSLLFLVKSNDSIDNILKILEEKEVHATFFIDGSFAEKNNDKLIEIINKGHDIGNLSYNMNYSHHSYAWLDATIKKISKQKNGYCYTENESKSIRSVCSMSSNYTIIPSLVVNSNPMITIKQNIKAGDFISLPVCSEVEQELALIISFIQSKGYSIESLSNHLRE